jgi:hypothetical protein
VERPLWAFACFRDRHQASPRIRDTSPFLQVGRFRREFYRNLGTRPTCPSCLCRIQVLSHGLIWGQLKPEARYTIKSLTWQPGAESAAVAMSFLHQKC